MRARVFRHLFADAAPVGNTWWAPDVWGVCDASLHARPPAAPTGSSRALTSRRPTPGGGSRRRQSRLPARSAGVAARLPAPSGLPPMTLASVTGGGPLAPAAPARRSVLAQSLDELTREHPTTRKHLVGPDVNHGRELLVALGGDIGGRSGWEAPSLEAVADALAYVPLARRADRIRWLGNLVVRPRAGRWPDLALECQGGRRHSGMLMIGLAVKQSVCSDWCRLPAVPGSGRGHHPVGSAPSLCRPAGRRCTCPVVATPTMSVRAPFPLPRNTPSATAELPNAIC